jgi:GNAT superfamily N-acetyltransferase
MAAGDEQRFHRAREAWRAMKPADLPAVAALAAAIHVAHPEEDAVFAERLALFPAGCLVLESPGGVAGYVLAHPWRRLAPPALNTRLGALPADADCLYLHDVALAPSARGRGAAAAALARLDALARTSHLPCIALIAVGGTMAFWTRQGFVAVDAPSLAAKLRSYDAGARLMQRLLG